MPISEQQRRDIDKIWDRLVSQGGFRDLGFKLSDQLGAIATAEPITLWVDAVNGNDLNPGNEVQPLKTITESFKRVPLIRDHAVTINIKAGTYVENVVLVGLSGPTSSSLITIKGVDWTASTMATGVQTGSITSQSDTVVTVTGAGWTVDNLRGKFLRMTSGAQSGNAFAIASNTADTAELCTTTSMGASSTFEIVEPAAVLAPTVVSNALTISSLGGGAFNVKVQALKIVGIGAFDGVVIRNGNVWLDRCLFSSTLTGGNVGLRGVTARCYFGHSIVMNQATSSGRGIDHEQGQLTVDSSLLDGGNFTGGSASYGIFVADGYLLRMDAGATVIQRWKQTNSLGLIFNNGTSKFLGNRFHIRDCYQGILLGQNTSMELDNAFVQNCTSHGVQVGGAFGGFSGLDASGKITVTGCGGDGIRLSAGCNWVHLGSTSVIQNNTGFGVNMAPDKFTTHGTVYLGGGTMSGNTAGDFSVDGTATSLATLAGDPDKVITDPLRFNRLVHE